MIIMIDLRIDDPYQTFFEITSPEQLYRTLSLNIVPDTLREQLI